jgi:glycerol-3-phosphate dehydrogenase (NAD(P)+)
MKLAVLGAGAWGTALAIQAGRRHRTLLWSRDPAQVAQMQQQRHNERYLPGIAFSHHLEVVGGEPLAHLTDADLVVLAGPTASLRPLLLSLTPGARLDCPLVWLCKGFESALSGLAQAGLMPHEVQAQVAPKLQCGALSGPSFAQEVAQGLPTALVAASPHGAVRRALVETFHGDSLRIYENPDIVGVEVGGAVKNVMAIATGLCDGMALGHNARAALITRGLAEMTRLGLALGAKADTFMGLSGLGDLVLTATGDLSRNRRVGLALAQGQTLQQAVDALGHVAEGVYSARTVVQRAAALKVEMPIASAVVELLEGRISPRQAVGLLMNRQSKTEA